MKPFRSRTGKRRGGARVRKVEALILLSEVEVVRACAADSGMKNGFQREMENPLHGHRSKPNRNAINEKIID